MDDWVQSLAVHDDGTGAALFAGGGFFTAGGVSAVDIADVERLELVAARSGSFFPLGTTIVHRTATDDQGYQSTCEFP